MHNTRSWGQKSQTQSQPEKVREPCVTRLPGKKGSDVAHWRLEGRRATPSMVSPTGEGGKGKNWKV